MKLRDKIEKLLEGNNTDDWEIAVTLLESEGIPEEERLAFIENYFKNNKPYYSDRDDKLIRVWIESFKNKNKN